MGSKERGGGGGLVAAPARERSPVRHAVLIAPQAASPGVAPVVAKPLAIMTCGALAADADRGRGPQVLPIGGPGEALDPVQQSELLFGLIGSSPKTLKVPVALMDGVIGLLDFLAKFAPNLKDAAEFGRIGKYYATESMLVYDADKGVYDADATPSYGKETLEMFFSRVLKEGLKGQELGDQAVFK